MADYPNLEANLNYLIKNDAIPDTDPGHIGDHIKQAINDLSESEMATLVKLAKTAGAHLFMHDKDNHIIAMGL